MDNMEYAGMKQISVVVNSPGDLRYKSNLDKNLQFITDIEMTTRNFETDVR